MKNKKQTQIKTRSQIAILAHFKSGSGAHLSKKDKANKRNSKQSLALKKELKTFLFK